MPSIIEKLRTGYKIFSTGYWTEDFIDRKLEGKAARLNEESKKQINPTELQKTGGLAVRLFGKALFHGDVGSFIGSNQLRTINRTPRANIADRLVITEKEKKIAEEKMKSKVKRFFHAITHPFVSKQQQAKYADQLNQAGILFELGRATHQTVEHVTDFHRSRILNSALPVTVMWIALMTLAPNKKRWFGSVALMSTPLIFASNNQLTSAVEDWNIKNVKVGAAALKGIRGVHKTFGFFRKQVNRNFITAGALVALIAATRLKMIPHATVNRLALKGACVLSAVVASHAWAWEARREINNQPAKV